jgi:hypothetical protein
MIETSFSISFRWDRTGDSIEHGKHNFLKRGRAYIRHRGFPDESGLLRFITDIPLDRALHQLAAVL